MGVGGRGGSGEPLPGEALPLYSYPQKGGGLRHCSGSLSFVLGEGSRVSGGCPRNFDAKGRTGADRDSWGEGWPRGIPPNVETTRARLSLVYSFALG